MTRSIHKSALMIPAVIIVCAVVAAAQLPTITIQSNGTPTSQEAPMFGGFTCAGSSGAVQNSAVQNYVRMTKFTVTGAGLANVDIPMSDNVDSIRLRGNSTAGSSMLTVSKKSYRVKFDKRRPLLGMDESKSWALLANYYDASLMLSVIAFELGKKMGLENSRPYQFVKVNFNGKDDGVYVLTPQISGNRYGGVNVDINSGGWLVEFTHYGPSDQTDCQRFFTMDPAPNTGCMFGCPASTNYNMNTKIRSPELDEISNPSTGLNYVKTDLNNLVSKMKENGFPNNGYRDLMDVEDWAKYVLINLFMDNADFNTAANSHLGSNYAYKVNNAGKIKAGPLWDFDLAAGVNSSNQSHFSSYTNRTAPSHPFYSRLWSDNNGGFRTCYVSIWNEHRDMIKAVGNDGGLIDQLMNQIAPNINGNVAANGIMGSTTTYNEASYKQHVGRLKTWWNQRYTHFDNAVKNLSVSGSCPGGAPPNPGPYTVNVNRVPEAGGSVTVNGAVPNPGTTYPANTSVTVTAAANTNDGYSFNGWTVTSGSVGNANLSNTPIQFNISSNVTLTANFRHKDAVDPNPTCSGNNCVTITVSAGQGGTVWPSGSASYTSGAQATLKAVPAEGYRFVNWTVAAGQSLPGTFAPNAQSADATFTVNSARAFTANFVTTSSNISDIRRLSNGRNIMAVKNGLSLSVNSGADIRVVNLRGREVRKASLTRGNHTVPLGDLPKGMYMISAIVDGREFTLRVPVR